jgi:CRP-like cAMP-binding protein
MMTGVSVFDDYLRPTTATALSPTTLLQMDRKSLQNLKVKEPELALEVFADASCFMMQVLREFANLTAEYLDVPIE